jgi:hypothetical protein
MDQARLLRIFTVIALGLLLWTAAPPLVEAKHGCTLKSVDGSYGFIVTGTNLPLGLVSSVGIVTSDGRGNLTGADTVSAAGTILRRTITGTYTVATNCTGAVTFTDNFGQTVNLDFVLADGGDELQFIQTDPGTVITGRGTKI